MSFAKHLKTETYLSVVSFCSNLLGRVICALVVFSLTYASASDDINSSPFTVGILPLGDKESVNKVSDLMTADFTEEGRVHLVERDKLDKMRREKNLSVIFSSPQQRLRLGRTVGADFLIFLDRKGAEKQIKEIRLRAVDCQTGAIVYENVLPFHEEKAPESLLQKASQALLQKMNWMSKVSRDELVPVSIPTINCLAPEAVSDQQLARRIHRRLRARLGSRPEIICLERQEMKRAKREIEDFKGKAADFWNSSVIVTGTAGLQGENLRELFVSLKLLLPDGKEQKLKTVISKSRNLDNTMEILARRIAGELGNDKKSDVKKEFTRETEVQWFYSNAKIYSSKSMYKKARDALETAFALQSDPPNLKQRYLMAQIIRQIDPATDPNATAQEKYFAQIEKYIYLFENYLKPEKDLSFYRGDSIKADLRCFVNSSRIKSLLQKPPRQIARIIQKRNEGAKDELIRRSVELKLRRLDYLRQLWRSWVLPLQNLDEFQNVFLSLWTDPVKIVKWYHDYWDTAIEQLINPVKKNGSPTKGPTYFTRKTANWFRRTGRGTPLSEDKSQRGIFLLNVVKRYMAIPNGNIDYYDDYQLKGLRKINYNAVTELCRRLSLSEQVKALVLVRFAYMPGMPRHIFGPIGMSRKEFKTNAETLRDVIRKGRQNSSPHWIYSRLIGETARDTSEREVRRFRKDVANAFWAALFCLPAKDQLKVYKKHYKPLIKEYPDSILADHQVPAYWLYKKLLGNSNKKFAKPWQHLAADLLKLLRRQSKDMRDNKLLTSAISMMNSQYPDVAPPLEGNKEQDDDKGRKASGEKPPWPLLLPGDMLPKSALLDFWKYNTPQHWIMHGDKLWILWAAENGYAATALDIENHEIERITPVNFSLIPPNPEMAHLYPSGQPGAGTWAFSDKLIVIGLRSGMLQRTKTNYVTSYATCLVPTNKDSDKWKNVESLSGLVKEASPAGNLAGRKPNPERAAQKISAFCSLKNVFYFANQHSMYSWNQRDNTLNLLASYQDQTEQNSPLNGGNAYKVYWMGADPEMQRILIGIQESKPHGEYFGPRTGIWAYYPDKGKWRHIKKMFLHPLQLPRQLSLCVAQEGVTFNSSHGCGKLDLAEKTVQCRGDDIGVGKKGGGWKRLPPLDPLVSKPKVHSTARYLHCIAHPYEDAWITSKITADKNRRLFWIENNKIIQQVTFKGVRHTRTSKGVKFDPAFKIIPVPEGALIWHLIKTEDGRLMPALLYWKIKPERDGKKVVYNLRQQYEDSDEKNSAKLSQMSVSGLIRILRTGSPQRQKRAAELLGKKRADEAVPALIEAAEKSYCYIRQEAVKALGRIEGKNVFQPLRRAFKDPDPDVRKAAVQALSSLENADVTGLIIQALKDRNMETRAEAATSLARQDTSRPVPPLIARLKDNEEHQRVRILAAMALGHIGDRRAVKPLIETLNADNEKVRKWAADALGSIGDKRAVEPLIGVFRDPEWPVRGRAREALQKMKTEFTIKPLIDVLEQGGSPQVRKLAAKTLKEITKQDFGQDADKWKKWWRETRSQGE